MRPELWPHSLLWQDLRDCFSQTANIVDAAGLQGGSYMPEPLSNASESHLKAEGFSQYAQRLSDAPLHACRVAAARFGGPIAMIRDDRQMVAVSGGMTQPVMRVYTAAGTLMSAFVWDKGPIVAMEWTDSEDLMVVQPDGQVGDCTAPGAC